MKKFVRRYVRQVIVGRQPNRGRVGMLHPSPARAFSDVKDERVMLEGRAAHHVDLVSADFAQLVFNLFLAPAISMNDNADVRGNSGHGELLEISNFNGS